MRGAPSTAPRARRAARPTPPDPAAERRHRARLRPSRASPATVADGRAGAARGGWPVPSPAVPDRVGEEAHAHRGRQVVVAPPDLALPRHIVVRDVPAP